MLNKLSHMLAAKLLEKVEKSNYDLEVYIYGFELIISTLACFATILFFSVMFSESGAGVLFIIVFASLRVFTGGYHANTYRNCFLITNLSYILLLLIKNALWNRLPLIVWWVILIIAMIYIWKATPIINVAQPISLQKQRICSRNARNILLFDAISCLFIAQVNKEMMSMMILTICLVAVFMIVVDKSTIYDEGRCS